MLPLEKNRRALILGLGSSGLVAVRFLHRHGMRVAVSEARQRTAIPVSQLEELERLDVESEWGGHSEQFLEPGCLVVPSPGVPLDQPVLKRADELGCAVYGELALAAGRFSVPVIGVTGTNGKTTVTSLIGHLLQGDGGEIFIGGNIGRPLLEFFEQPASYRMAVLELSSFQLELSGDFRPDFGLLLNITPDHLDRHGGLAAYLAAKKRIFSSQKQGDVALIGADDPLLADLDTGTGVRLRFGQNPGFEACATRSGVLISCSCKGLDLDEAYDLRGTHLTSMVNRLNAAAAVLAVRVAGCSREAVRRGLHTFVPADHRMRPVARHNGVVFVDDSKATNTGAMAAAIASFDPPLILIAGGQAKGCTFQPLASLVRDRVKLLVLLGQDADLLADAFAHLVPTVRAGSMEEAVRVAWEKAEAGDTVLLAPGCASFDMFSGYAERGRIFADLVQKLLSEKEELEQ